MNADEPIDLTSLRSGDGHPSNGQVRNGSAVHDTSSKVGSSASSDLDGVDWYPTYERAAVESYLAGLDRERERLQNQIRDAERRTDAAQATMASRTADLEARLGAVVLAARTELDRVDREQTAAVEAIKVEADAEVARIRATARHEADIVRDAATTLSRLADMNGSDPASPPSSVNPPSAAGLESPWAPPSSSRLPGPGPWPLTAPAAPASPAANGSAPREDVPDAG